MSRARVLLPLVLGVWLWPSAAMAVDGAPPAGGVPTEDLIPSIIVGIILFALVIGLGWAHRAPKTTLLSKTGDLAARAVGLPGYAALPVLLVGGALLIAVFGFYWDVSTHIDNGRDPGPFANPSHWFIIVGLLGIALAGALCLFLGVDDDHPTGVKLREGWHVPIGGLALTVCGVIALLGFPMDDVWHRIFGQDVTLWSPTHIQMVGGASLSTLCLWILMVEGRRDPRFDTSNERLRSFTAPLLAGAFLIGASTLQAEYDYAVPQFRLLYQPVLLMIAAGIALVPARILLGRGGALKAIAVFIGIRGILTLLVSGMLGRTLLHFPLYLGAAIAVELIATRVSTERQLTFGAWAGLGVGTLGLAWEWLWTALWMPITWPAGMMLEAVAIATPAAVGAGLVGGFITRALLPAEAPRQQVPTWVAGVAGVVVVAALIYPIPMTGLPGATAQVTLEDVEGGDNRTVNATIRIDPAEAAAGADYVNVTAWQGAQWRDVQSFADPLEQVDEGVYRTTRPIPVHGEWKALIRLHSGRVMVAAPIFLPEDKAIPADEVPAESSFTREFIEGEKILLREAKEAPGWITTFAYILTLGVIVAWIALVGWAVRHLRKTSAGEPRRPRSGRANRRPRHATA